MTKPDLIKLLKEQTGDSDLREGYNYCIFSILAHDPQAVAAQLRSNKLSIERSYAVMVHKDWAGLLPFVCLVRPRSVLLPIHHETQLNPLADIVNQFVHNASVPSWA